MKKLRVEFKNRNGYVLTGKMVLPADQKPHNYALFAHCFTCNKNLNAVRTISNALTNHGFAVLSFDFTGLGSSGGDFSDTNFSSNVDDLISASEFLRDNYRAPTLIIGHSLGGAAAIFAAGEIDPVKAVVTIAAPSDPEHVKHLFEDSREDIERKGQARVKIGGRPFVIKKQLIDDLEKHRLHDVLDKMRKSLLIIHSPQDSIVGIDHAAGLYKAAHHPKSFVSLDEADHLLSNKEDAAYVGNLIASWADRYLDREEETIQSSYQVSVRIGDEDDKFVTKVLAGNHHFLADEPEDAGGDDLGPTPYQLLSASLGTCTAMTLRMYLNHKGWDVEEILVHLEHDKKHMEDCEDCENKSSKIDHFKRLIEIKGDLTDEQRQRLLDIANKCPVHRTLLGDIEINTEIL